jgi:hypothetical protein
VECWTTSVILSLSNMKPKLSRQRRVLPLESLGHSIPIQAEHFLTRWSAIETEGTIPRGGHEACTNEKAFLGDLNVSEWSVIRENIVVNLTAHFLSQFQRVS